MADVKDIMVPKKFSDLIHCLTIPLHNETALLPNAAIAEVVAYKTPTSIGDAPEWFLGFIEWREKRVPIISFEAVSGKSVQPAKNTSRIAILNTLNGNLKIPYVGILSQGIPSLAVVHKDRLEDKSGNTKKRQSVGAFIEIGDLQALIPNIDEIEQRLISLNLS